MSTPITYDLNILEYNGPKNPEMPEYAAENVILPLKILSSIIISKERAMNDDFAFLNDVISFENIPEFNGLEPCAGRVIFFGLRDPQAADFCGAKTLYINLRGGAGAG